MGASLADGAWGRESAVYRVSGVISVIGGWFFTALIAFISSFIMAFFIYYTGFIGLFILIILAGYLIYHTYSSFNKKKREELIEDEEDIAISEETPAISAQHILEKTLHTSGKMLDDIPQVIDYCIDGLKSENLKSCQKAKDINSLWHKKTKRMKSKISKVIDKLSEESVFAGNQYVRIVENLRDLFYATQMIVNPSKQHVTNYHKPFSEEQIKAIKSINSDLVEFFSLIKDSMKNTSDEAIFNIKSVRNKILDILEDERKAQLKRIKKGNTSIRNSMLFIDILNEFKNILLSGYSLVKVIVEFKNELHLENSKNIEENDSTE